MAAREPRSRLALVAGDRGGSSPAGVLKEVARVDLLASSAGWRGSARGSWGVENPRGLVCEPT